MLLREAVVKRRRKRSDPDEDLRFDKNFGGRLSLTAHHFDTMFENLAHEFNFHSHKNCFYLFTNLFQNRLIQLKLPAEFPLAV